MTAITPPTQATMERAIRAAKKQGCKVVEVKGGDIRILLDENIDHTPAIGEGLPEAWS